MAKIPEQTVREILERTDIIAVIGEHVRLQRSGNEYKGLCPFHAEKTPSFYVIPGKNIFHCFGCQKGGDVITFLREIDKLGFTEAVEVLAKRAGIALQVEEAPSEEERERRSLLELYERLAGTFHWMLTEKESAGPARETLKKRGIPEALVEEFRLGYSPSDRRWLFGFLRSKGYSDGFLGRSGLFSANNPGYPLFAGRLMFPIADLRGRVVAFGGRLLEGEGPKYINSPDTSLFRKQDNLFAIDKALPSIKTQGVALVCEGYMDAISFHAAGVGIAIAPLGTAFTPSQARLIKRWADRILLCFDADEAGQRAAERACAISAAAGLDSSVVTLPGGKDASEILEKDGPETLQKNGDFTINGNEFLVRRARKLFDTGTVEGKAKAAAYLYPFIDALDAEIKRSAFLDFASRELGANPISIRNDYEAAKRGSASKSSRGDQPDAGTSARAAQTPDLVFLAAVVLSADRYLDVRSKVALDDLDDFRARDLYIALEEAYRADDLGVESVLARVEDESARLFVRECAAHGVFTANPERLLDDGIAIVRRRSIARRRERVLTRIAELETGRSGGPSGDSALDYASLNDLLYEKMQLDAELENTKGERDERP
jgi:DNA primase